MCVGFPFILIIKYNTKKNAPFSFGKNAVVTCYFLKSFRLLHSAVYIVVKSTFHLVYQDEIWRWYVYLNVLKIYYLIVIYTCAFQSLYFC